MTAAMTAIMYTGREPKRGSSPPARLPACLEVDPTHSQTQPTVVLFLPPSRLLAQSLLLSLSFSRPVSRQQYERFVGIKFGCTT